MEPKVVTPKDQLHELLTLSFLSSRFPSRGREPGEVVGSWPEEHPIRERLRGLKSDDLAEAPYFTYVFGVVPGGPGARRGRWNLSTADRCSVPGCQLLRPTHTAEGSVRFFNEQDTTCLRHTKRG